MKANRAEIERALAAPPAHIRLFLLYGPDEGESLALARLLERAMGAEAERVDLDGATLKADPARLSDEAASISLFGDKRFVSLSITGDECFPAIEALLDGDVAGNPVVAVAGALRPTSLLLKRALADPAVLACISYALDPERAAPLAAAMAREVGVRLEMDAARHIAGAAANDRAIMVQEVEKLALYLDAAPDRPVTADMAALEAIGAGEGEAELSRVVDATLGGNPAETAREIAQLSEQGVTGIPAIRALAKRVQLLVRLATQVARGADARAVVEAQGKAIFWKEKASVERQLKRWSPERLATLADRLLTAERAIKSAGSPGDIMANVEMITVSRAAQRSR